MKSKRLKTCPKCNDYIKLIEVKKNNGQYSMDCPKCGFRQVFKKRKRVKYIPSDEYLVK